MSASPEYFEEEPPKTRAQERAVAPEPTEELSEASFWHWFAIGVLLFCWIAEASMCADRGF